MKAYQLWRAKSEDREAAVYHAKLQHMVNRQAEAQRQVRGLLDYGQASWMGGIDELTTATDAMGKINHFLTRIGQIHQVGADQILVLGVLNWSAPSLISSQQQTTQASVLGGLVNGGSPHCVGLVVSPSHTYGKGKLYKHQEVSHKLLVNANLNIDASFVIPFKQRNDPRDERPGMMLLKSCFNSSAF